ncbi:MAG TPA: LysR family transcriptional regulator [Polyangiaceae bacterium]|jgi:LysR family transcriptional activator of nhaA|nr:LysR family transcriptional regulator [Polyangiaceae bacterium]
MEWLNYHHLYYFSVIAEEGGLARAARKLRLTHSTLSAQLRTLETHFGTPLFERRGKRLVLTSFGTDALNYATDIFRLGRELNDVARGASPSPRDVLRIGVVAGLPKTLTHHLLAPALDSGTCVLLVRQDSPSTLLEALLAGRLHVVLMNEVPTAPFGASVHSHGLGETDILLYARTRLAQLGKRRFPESLSGLPFVLPPPGAPLRRRLDAWFVERGLTITVKAELEDAGLLRAFGSAGRGIFPVRAALRAEVEDLRGVQLVGACSGVRERYYAVTTERRILHEALAAIIEGARAELNATERPAKTS